MPKIFSDEETERILIEKAKTSPTAFGELYDLHYPYIYRYFIYKAHDPDVAHDLTAEVFIKALNNIHKFHWRGTPWLAWLYKIAYREWLKFIHQPQNLTQASWTESNETQATYPTHNIQDTHVLAIDSLNHQALRQVLLRLPNLEQEIINLRIFEGKAFAEIAELLDRSCGAIKMRYKRALQKLHENLIQHPYVQINTTGN